MSVTYDCVHEDLIQSHSTDIQSLKTRADYKDKRLDDLDAKIEKMSEKLDKMNENISKEQKIKELKKELLILETLNIKPNFSELSRKYGIDRRVIKNTMKVMKKII